VGDGFQQRSNPVSSKEGKKLHHKNHHYKNRIKTEKGGRISTSLPDREKISGEHLTNGGKMKF